jgi:hypothetical protein
VESTVQPGETLVIRLSAALPVELQPGGFWCALTVDEIPDPLAQQEEGVGVRFVASVSTGVFVYVDPVERLATIVDLEVGATEARVKVRNEGNVPLGIDGRLEFFAPNASAPTATADMARWTLLTEPSREGIMSNLPPVAVLPSAAIAYERFSISARIYIGAEREVDIIAGAGSGPPGNSWPSSGSSAIF